MLRSNLPNDPRRINAVAKMVLSPLTQQRAEEKAKLAELNKRLVCRILFEIVCSYIHNAQTEFCMVLYFSPTPLNS